MRRLQVIVAWLTVLLVTLGSAGFSANALADSLARACNKGKSEARDGRPSSALREWRNIAYDATYKEWLRVVVYCLKSSGLAAEDRSAIDWLRDATTPDDTDALILRAIAYANGLGVSEDIQEAERLLVKAKAQGSEPANVLLEALWQRGR